MKASLFARASPDNLSKSPPPISTEIEKCLMEVDKSIFAKRIFKSSMKMIEERRFEEQANEGRRYSEEVQRRLKLRAQLRRKNLEEGINALAVLLPSARDMFNFKSIMEKQSLGDFKNSYKLETKLNTFKKEEKLRNIIDGMIPKGTLLY